MEPETCSLEKAQRLEKALAEVKAENQRLHRFVKDSGTTCWSCEVCGHARSGRGCMHCELTRLRELEARLPRTADGVPVVPGMPVWCPDRLAINGTPYPDAWSLPPENIPKLYAHRENAEAAQQARREVQDAEG